MEILSVKNPRWGNAEHTSVDVVLSTEAFTDYPFTAAANAPVDYNRQVFTEVVAGLHGEIAEYIAPELVPVIPQVVSKAQGIAVLMAQGLWPQIKAYLETEATPEDRELFAAVTEFNRASPLLQKLATQFELSSEALDQLFIAGANVVI